MFQSTSNSHMRDTFGFLKALAKNNNREWFTANKDSYQASLEEVKRFSSRLAEQMKRHDNIDDSRTKVFRIYRDTRFAKDKTPYKNGWSGSFGRATKALRGGYYFHLEPGNSYLAGGFFGPSPQDLVHIRKHLSQDASAFRAIIDDTSFKQVFGDMLGEQVKSAPKGFQKDDPNIDLLRYKQFYFNHNLDDQELMGHEPEVKVSKIFQAIRPYFDVMSEILTTDLNGISLI
ncbi:MAG: DUF2461 domain-containing protein [Cyclobacteriaceae bacterium]|nr:DUF2461 domain-containing protein [Cyclobacteriaceae bacterium HetDA_MAG_MS6]